jgi:hypothetical protein
MRVWTVVAANKVKLLLGDEPKPLIHNRTFARDQVREVHGAVKESVEIVVKVGHKQLDWVSHSDHVDFVLLLDGVTKV